MKIEMNNKGRLMIKPETYIEEYALLAWSKEHEIVSEGPEGFSGITIVGLNLPTQGVKESFEFEDEK